MLQACLISLLQSFRLAFTVEGLSFSHCHTELSYTTSFIRIILSGFTTLRGLPSFILWVFYSKYIFKVFLHVLRSCAVGFSLF